MRFAPCLAFRVSGGIGQGSSTALKRSQVKKRRLKRSALLKLFTKDFYVMTNNLYEFISAVLLVSIFTSAAIMFRYVIYKMGKQDEVLQRVRVDKNKKDNENQ